MVNLELWIIYNYGLWLNLGDNYKFCKTKNLMVDRHCVKVANLYSVTVCGLLSGFRNYKWPTNVARFGTLYMAVS